MHGFFRNPQHNWMMPSSSDGKCRRSDNYLLYLFRNPVYGPLVPVPRTIFLQAQRFSLTLVQVRLLSALACMSPLYYYYYTLLHHMSKLCLCCYLTNPLLIRYLGSTLHLPPSYTKLITPHPPFSPPCIYRE